MNFEEALKIELESVTGLNARVFPINAPDGFASPYCIYETSGKAEDKTYDGYLDTGRLTCTVDVIADTYTSMKSYGDLVQAKIKTFQSRIIGSTGPYIQDLTFDELNPELFETQIDKYRKSIGFTVYY